VTPRNALLTGVVHLPPLPGSPRAELSAREVARRAAEDARILLAAGFDAALVENFGDAPYLPRVGPVTVSAMTVAALAVRDACPKMKLGINVLRNDAEAALAIAVAAGADFVRVNVHTGARVTDQGLIEGRAGETLRMRRALGAESVRIWADVDVKHSAPLAPRSIEDEAKDLESRGLADAVLVTGEGTGRPVDIDKLEAVRRGVTKPVFVASGATVESLERLASQCDGVLVGSALRKDGKAGGPIDAARAKTFAEAFRRAFAKG
jgi:membrane complex biogenesis BtpA family protein